MINVSVVILTFNEKLNLPTCLESLREFDDIVIVDSYSEDNTESIASEYKTRFYKNAFTGHGDQRNWVLNNIEFKYDWVLFLDADERLTKNLIDEIKTKIAACDAGVCAYSIKRRFYMWGRWLKYSSLYPTWVVRLIRKGKVVYLNKGHSETQIVDGEISQLTHDIIDENKKSIEEWFDRQNKYSLKEAEYELEQENKNINYMNIITSDELLRRATLKHIASKLPARTLFYFIYSYLIRFGFLDGKDGFVFCLMKSIYQEMIVIKKYDLKKNIKLTR